MMSRSAVEARSAVLLVYLRGLPRWIVAVVVAAVLLGGLFSHGVFSTILLAVIAILAGWLCYLSWPRAALPARGMRCLIILALLALAVARIAV